MDELADDFMEETAWEDEDVVAGRSGYEKSENGGGRKLPLALIGQPFFL